MVLRRFDGDEAEFGVVSFSDSLDNVKAFAGEDNDKARYFPDDRRSLARFPREAEALRGRPGAVNTPSAGRL